MIATARQIFTHQPPFVKPLQAETRDAYALISVAAVLGLLWIAFSTDRLRVTAFDLVGLKGEVGKVQQQVQTVQSDVNQLAKQIEQIYASQITEVFDEQHRNRVKFVEEKYGDQVGVHVEILLKQEPIIASLQIIRNDLILAPNLLNVNGKRIIFPTFPGHFEGPYDAIVVVYHPKVQSKPTEERGK
jgi:hypothetical protein